MRLTGLHLLLTYQCTNHCEHCFVWGSPFQHGTMTLDMIYEILRQAGEVGAVRTIYFEGGEPFLYYATLLQGVEAAASLGFETGIVTNAFWASSPADALAALKPFAGLLKAITVSTDLFHGSQPISPQSRYASAAAQQLGISVGTIRIAKPVGEDQGQRTVGQLPEGEGQVMFRGRAAARLAHAAPQHPWQTFHRCPHEDLREPGRVHLDPLGNVHLCQGLSAGNFLQQPLASICAAYDPDSHPVCGPLLRGGPAGLAREYGIEPEGAYADACQLCYEARLQLRPRFPGCLGPDAMYGIFRGS